MDDFTIFTARVLSTDAGTYNVLIEPQGNNPNSPGTMQAIPVAGTLAHFLGFKDATLPQVGSFGLCIRNSKNECWFLGTVPHPDLDKPYAMRSLVGGGNPPAFDNQNSAGYKALNKAVLNNANRPTDVVAGEKVISNDFGVLLGLFQQLATLKASELAQIQCYVLDDLVRIISHNFQHYTALGEVRVFHDGSRIGMEVGATHIPAESVGVPKVDSATVDSPFEAVDDLTKYSDDTKNFYTLKDERLVAVERLKFFLGGVADFIQLLLVAPTKGNKYLMDGANPTSPDRGLLQVNVSTDGGFYLRSLKEVAIEKTNWIRVPQRIRVPEDPKGDDGIKTKTRPQFKFDNRFKFSNNPFVYFLQLRDYLASVNENFNYLNFRENTKDFLVNDDISKEVKVSDLKKISPEVTTEYTAKTAGVYLLPNGGLVLKDGSGSAIVMEGGNIYLQPANDLVAQPLRSFIAKVGGFINLGAYKDIDLYSTDGGMRIKTKKSQYLYSDKSGVVLESAGADFDGSIPTGVTLKATTGINQYSSNHLISTTSNCIISSLGTVGLETKGTLMLSAYGSGGLDLYSSSDVSILAKRSMMLESDSFTAAGQSNTRIGVVKKNFASAIGGSTTLGVQGFNREQDVASTLASIDIMQRQRLQTLSPEFPTNTAFDNLKFKFLNSADYGISGSTDIIPQTVAQQEDTKTNYLNLENWQEIEVNGTLPYPGKDLFGNFYVTNSRLDGYQVYENELYANGTNEVDYSSILRQESMNEYTRKA